MNGEAKKFMRKEFVTYYANAVQQQIEDGKALEDIEVDLKLTIIKPLHARGW